MELADLWVYDVPARRNSNREQHRIIFHCHRAIPPHTKPKYSGTNPSQFELYNRLENLHDVQNASCNIITWAISISEDDVVRSGMFLHIPA